MSNYQHERGWLDSGAHCTGCGETICAPNGQPYISFKRLHLCGDCALGLIEPIYSMGGMGLIQVLVFNEIVSSPIHRQKRRQIKDYERVFNKLLHKYKFCCVTCHEKDKALLSIDHIKPVSKGGTDDLENLQIMCRSCNSKKGAKYAVV